MHRPLRVAGALVALAALSLPARPQSDSERARTLFLTNCASCHGETGDGKGTTQLDRPARSFQDGGFSFGNTPEALFKTISTGIPGSPMAGFDSSLTEDERRLLASYVVTLGPPVEEVKEADMILEVHDRPLVVRGLLPSLGEGLPTHPRGLLVGDPSGITFEYRADDVRLLALRQGGFVKRTDWSGRGGTALEPLGKVVHLVEGGKPEASFFLGAQPLVARLSATQSLAPGSTLPFMDGGGATTRVGWPAMTLEYHLVGNGREIAHVREIPHVRVAAMGTGYQRDFWFTSASVSGTVAFRTPLTASGALLARGANEFGRWSVLRAPEQPPLLTAVDFDAPAIRDLPSGQLEVSITLKPEDKYRGFSMVSLVLVDWNAEIEAQVAEWWEEF